MKLLRSPKPATDRRRRQILDAALQIFLQQGVDRATIDEIRAASGASSGSIYHHFGSKEAIALALYVEGFESYQRALLDKLGAQRTAARGIRALISEHLRWTETDPHLSLYLTRVSTADVSGETAARITEVNQRFFQSVCSWIAPFVECGQVRRLPPDMYASIIFGPVSMFARHWLTGRMDLEIKPAARALGDAACQALLLPLAAVSVRGKPC